MLFNKDIKFNNKGFSLAESVAIGAILGIVSMAFLNIQTEKYRNKSLAKYYDIINLTVNTVQSHLVDYEKSNTFLNSFTRSQLSNPSGHPISQITIGPSNKILTVAVSNMKGKINDKNIKQAISSNDHLIKNKLYISEIKLFYKRKFQGVEDSSDLSQKEEHGFVVVEISFHLNTGGFNRIIKRKTSVNIVYESSGNISRTLSLGGRLAKVFEDEVCATKHGGTLVGKYDSGKCKEYDKLASNAIRYKSCEELGGTALSGKCRYEFFSLGATECLDGIKGFDIDGNAICLQKGPSIKISLAMNNTCAIKDGILKCWGHNTFGQVGIGGSSYSPETTPQLVKLPAGRKTVLVVAETHYTCALLDNNDLTCWGKNEHGLWPGGTIRSRRPLKVPITGGRIKSFVTGGHMEYNYCVILDDDSLKCWGTNRHGELGHSPWNPKVDIPTPVPIGGLVSSVVKASSVACSILKNSGVLKCWGKNLYRAVGIGSVSPAVRSPKTVTLGEKATSVSIGKWGSDVCAILESGILKCWGGNTNGLVGVNSLSPLVPLPTQVNFGAGLTVKSLKSGYSRHNCVILSNDTLNCWGSNSFGEVGNNSRINQKTPQIVNLGGKVKSFELGLNYTCAILDNNNLKCWGKNDKGQLGTGARIMQKLPKLVSLGIGKTAKFMKATFYHACAVLNDGTLKCWGQNSKGQLGIGSQMSQSTPQNVNL